MTYVRNWEAKGPHERPTLNFPAIFPLDMTSPPDYISSHVRGVLTAIPGLLRALDTPFRLRNGGESTMAVNITPLHDRVLVKRVEEKESVRGGIIIPDTAKEKPQEGEVVAVGAGKIEKGERVPLDVKAGDRILFGKYSGSEIKIEDQEYLILREDEILAKLSGAAKAAKK
jgi:chaperonin GroES